jgi:hypothetical protein
MVWVLTRYGMLPHLYFHMLTFGRGVGLNAPTFDITPLPQTLSGIYVSLYAFEFEKLRIALQ